MRRVCAPFHYNQQPSVMSYTTTNRFQLYARYLEAVILIHLDISVQQIASLDRGGHAVQYEHMHGWYTGVLP